MPFRARETEAFLTGRPAHEGTFLQTAEIAAREANSRTSPLRASQE